MVDILIDIICRIGKATSVAVILIAIVLAFAVPWVIAYACGMTTGWIIGCIVWDALLGCMYLGLVLEE